MRSALAVLAVLAPLLPACREPADEPSRTLPERDLSGIPVIESTEPAARWTVDTTPILQVGQEGRGPHVFQRVMDMGRLDSGSIVVIDEAPPHARLFSSVGGFLASTGEAGDGPGEFRRPASLGILPGDSLAVYDAGNGRLTILGSDLSFIDARRVTDGETRPPRSLTQIDDTLFVVNESLGPGELRALGLGMHRPLRPTMLVGSSGRLLGPVAELPTGDVYVREMSMGPPLFAARTLFGGHEGLLVVGFAESTEIERMSLDGQVLRIDRLLDGVDRSVSQADLTLEIDRRVEVYSRTQDDSPDDIRRRLLDRPRMERKPAYSHLLVDTEGAAWLGEYVSEPFLVPPIPPERWHVVALDGAWATTIELPEGFIPFRIGLDWILGVRRDELDVESVVMYSLSRAGMDNPVQ